MNSNVCRRRFGFLALALIMMVAGCTSSKQIADQVAELNRGLEDGHNGLLLLNIVRAYKHHPMHFMRISSLRGGVQPGSSTFGVPLPVGGDALALYNFSASFSTARPTFDTQILDNQEFIRGITTPIPITTMLYYLEQGWPQQMVLHIFVRSVDILVKQDGQDVLTARLLNYPQNQSEFRAFQSFVHDLRGCNIGIDARSDREAVGPVYPASAFSDPRSVAAAKSAEFQLQGTDAQGNPVDANLPTHYRFFEVRSRSFLKITDSPGPDGPCRALTQATVFTARSGEQKPGAGAEPSTTKPGERTMVLALRSPEAMVYYLGEVARAQLDGVYDARTGIFRPARPEDAIRIGYGAHRDPDRAIGSGVRLFSLVKGEVPPAATFKVELDGDTYSLPVGTRVDRSMHVLSLVSQVLMLQNKGAELPSTTSVRIIP